MKFSIALLSLLALAFIGCATVTPQQQSARDHLLRDNNIKFDDKGALDSAISQGNVNVVRLFFQSHSGVPLFSYGDSDPNIVFEGLLQDALKRADVVGDGVVRFLLEYPSIAAEQKSKIWTFYGNKDVCHDDLITLFIKKRIDPPADYRKLIADDPAKNFCVTSTKMVVTKYPDAAASALSAVSYQINNKNYQVNSDFFSKSMNSADQVIAILKSVNSDQCKKQNLESCGALSSFVKVEEKYGAEKKKYEDYLADNTKRANESDEAYKKDLAYDKSPQKPIDDACGLASAIRTNQEAIRYENKIGETSGFVNKENLYQAGRRVQAAQSALKLVKVEVRKRTGKDFSMSMCKKGEATADINSP